MRTTGWSLLAVILLLVQATNASAQARPDFSGHWKMNLEKSQFGGMAPPQSAEYNIRHKGANLSFDFTQDAKTTHLEFTTDGEERVTESRADAEVVTRVFWAGEVLTFESRVKARPAHQAEALRWTSKWELGPDGKSFSMHKHFVTSDGELEQTLVFDRQ